jgi:hypothetical protein
MPLQRVKTAASDLRVMLSLAFLASDVVQAGIEGRLRAGSE